MGKRLVVDCSTGCTQYSHTLKKQIPLIPVGLDYLNVHYNEVNMNVDEYFDLLANYKKDESKPNKGLPMTVPPTVQEIVDCFESYKAQGYDELIVVTISSGISGIASTIEAVVAPMFKNSLKITVFDTHNVCFNEGIFAVYATELVDKGVPTDTIIRHLQYMRDNQKLYAVEGTLDFLIYNGRLKGVKAVFGQLLKVCPIVEVATEVHPLTSARGQKMAMNKCWEIYMDFIGDLPPEGYRAYICYTGRKLLEPFKEIGSKLHGIQGIEEVPMSPTCGSHNGPVVVGLGVVKFPPADFK